MNRKILIALWLLLTPVAAQFVAPASLVFGQEILSVEEIAKFKNSILNENLAVPDEPGTFISRGDAEINLANIESETLANGPLEDIEIQAYFPTYQLSHATQITISDYSYRFYATNTQGEGASAAEEGMSYEEAVNFADTNPEMVTGFWQIFQNAIGAELTQEQYDWLPEDAAYWTLIQHSQTNPTGGDPATVIAALFEVYPELTNITTESAEDSILAAETFISNYYILHPGEGGNQSESQAIFVIEFNDFYDMEEWYNGAVVSQGEALSRADYPYDTGTKFVYYGLSDLETPINISLGADSYPIHPADLSNFPPASAVYISEDNTKAIIFHFGMMFLMLQNEERLEEFSLVTDPTIIPPEAARLIEEVKATTGQDSWYIYETHTNYQYGANTNDVHATKATPDSNNTADIGTFQAQTQWQAMAFNGTPYYSPGYLAE